MNIALILSGGRGRRLGTDMPKQYLEAGGRPVISYCLETLSCHEWIDGIQIVAEPAVMAGMDIVLIPGDERNFKITTKEDLRLFQEMTAALYTDEQQGRI